MEKGNKKIINEPFVEDSVRCFLTKAGFLDNGKKKELWEHGVDVKMKHKNCGWYFLVECKGEPGARGPVKSIGGSMSSSINSAIGQIVSRMHTNRKSRYGGYNFGIAFPASFREKVIKRVPYYVCKCLRLSLFFVSFNGSVEKIIWQELRKYQK
ncbi:MAG TPA: hypothetical protein PLA19_04795 [Candidatus Pacearchaeota archaeon]|nr:hypothetical protein [Candidatus Pacearchaeota archaeon]